MDIKSELIKRSNSKCELCGITENLNVHSVSTDKNESVGKSVLICSKCLKQIDSSEELDSNHWRCLNESMWSEFSAVQVIAWRVLTKLSVSEGWAQDLLEQLYLEDETLDWAKSGVESAGESESSTIVKDSNGVTLLAGDSVTIIKDLDVKGAGFTAKRGTVVKKISLVDDPELIEGRVNGVKIFLKTCFLKKI